MDAIMKRIAEIEKEMTGSDFWENKERARKFVKELSNLKEQKAGSGVKYDKGEAVLTLFSGAGGDDAEDWTEILFKMYSKFSEKKGWPVKILHEHRNDIGGIKNIAFEVQGKDAYGILKGEGGVHRLVRISSFSARKLRHTSFALLEVLPKFVEIADAKIDESDLLLAELTYKSIGIGIEVGYAKAKGKRIIYMHRIGTELSTTTSGVCDIRIEYKDISDLLVQLKKVLKKQYVR